MNPFVSRSRRTAVCLLLLVCMSIPAHAGSPLRIKFRARALLDAAISGYGKENVQGYYRLDDLRVGF